MASKVDVQREHGALRERIVDRLRADIIEGRLAPGTPLRTEEVMERFGVSNSPLRVGALLWETVYRWSIPRMTPGDISALRRASGDFELSMVSGDTVTALLDAERFQSLVADHCGSPELLRSVAAGGPRLRRLVRMLSPLDQLDAYALLHAETLAAAKDGDAERAASAVRAFWGNLSAAVDDVPLEEIAP
jgi:DNA-binding GntR family transcriptional regulator